MHIPSKNIHNPCYLNYNKKIINVSDQRPFQFGTWMRSQHPVVLRTRKTVLYKKSVEDELKNYCPTYQLSQICELFTRVWPDVFKASRRIKLNGAGWILKNFQCNRHHFHPGSAAATHWWMQASPLSFFIDFKKLAEMWCKKGLNRNSERSKYGLFDRNYCSSTRLGYQRRGEWGKVIFHYPNFSWSGFKVMFVCWPKKAKWRW